MSKKKNKKSQKKYKAKKLNLSAEESDLGKVEEEVIRAAKKSGKDNLVVNIFSYPHKKLKKRWNIRYKFNKKHLIMDLIILAGVLVLVGLNIFWFYGGFHYFGNKFELNLTTGKDQVASGEIMDFSVSYANNNKFELQNVVLSFNYPDNFQLLEFENKSYNYDKNIIKLGDLESGANAQMDFTGRVIGEYQSDQFVSLTANFFKTNKKGERLWGQFTQKSNCRYKLNNTYLDLKADFPEDLVDGQSFNLPIKIKNTSSDITYEKIYLDPRLSYDVALQGERLEYEKLEPGEEWDLEAKAKINSKKKKRDLRLSLFWQTEKFNLRQNTVSREIEIIRPDFQAFYIIKEDESVLPEEQVNFRLEYHNKGEFTIENVRLELVLQGEYWDLNNLAGDKPEIRDNVLVWTVKTRPELALIQPGEKGSIDFQVGTKNYVPGEQNTDLNSIFSYQYKLGEQDVLIEGQTKEIKLSSNLSARGYAAYFTKTGDQLGRGPVPPRVSEETKYWVFVKLINDINDVKNIKVSGTLPYNVSWLNESNVPVGNHISYDPKNKHVNWSIFEIPAGAEKIGFAFKVGIVPSQSQVGIYPPLLKNLTVSGQDKKTGQKITKNLGAITTKLYDEKGGFYDGPVK